MRSKRASHGGSRLSRVIIIEGNKTGIEFIDITPEVANKILYKYMQKKNRIKMSKK